MIRGSRGSKRAALIVGTAFLMLAAAAAVNVVPSAALDPPPPPIAGERAHGTLGLPRPDRDEAQAQVARRRHDGHQGRRPVPDDRRQVHGAAGPRFPWHTHYGPVIVNIVSGSLTYVEAGTCDEDVLAGTGVRRCRARSRPQRLQPRHGTGGVDRPRSSRRRNGPAADPGRPWLLAESAEPAAGRWAWSPPARRTALPHTGSCRRPQQPDDPDERRLGIGTCRASLVMSQAAARRGPRLPRRISFGGFNPTDRWVAGHNDAVV